MSWAYPKKTKIFSFLFFLKDLLGFWGLAIKNLKKVPYHLHNVKIRYGFSLLHAFRVEFKQCNVYGALSLIIMFEFNVHFFPIHHL